MLSTCASSDVWPCGDSRVYASGHGSRGGFMRVVPSLEALFRVSHNAISTLIPEVCQALIDELSPEVIQPPVTEDEWLEVAAAFHQKWNFPHCLGAVDGKHIHIQCPPGGGSEFYNYKRFHSIIMLAMCDANYVIRWMNIGASGSHSDAQLFNRSELQRVLDNNIAKVPQPRPLPGTQDSMPFFVIADDAFPLKT